jgi:inhibitor of cysteine peptidase
MNSLIFTESTAGNRITVPTQQAFEIHLRENPTTGYRWQLDLDECVALISSNFMPPQAGTFGAGGLRKFVLSADRPGEFEIRAILRRKWEPEGSEIERREFYITAA